MPKLLIGLAVLAVLCVAGAFLFVPSSSSRGPRLEPGAAALVRTSDGSPAAMAVDDAAWEDLEAALRARDEVGFRALIASGRVLIVDSGTPALVVGRSLSATEIRLTGGRQNGKRGWLPFEQVVKA